jgi:hypothetical protein
MSLLPAIFADARSVCATENLQPVPSEVQHFRYVATIRNRMMHDIDYNCLEHRERFLHACAAIDQAIDAILHRREPQRPPERLRTVERLLPEGLRRRIAKVCFFLWSSAS